MTDSRLSPGRYFLALWPPGAVRDSIAQLASEWLRPAARRFRPVRPGRYHLTLSFLGDLDASGAQRLETGLSSLRAWEGKPFRVVLDRVGHFGSDAGWLGCRHTPPELLDLHEVISQAMQRSGIRRSPSQSFVPHVTVARGMHGTWPPARAGFAHVAWDVRDWVLVRSTPSQGHAYRIVARQPLATP